MMAFFFYVLQKPTGCFRGVKLYIKCVTTLSFFSLTVILRRIQLCPNILHHFFSNSFPGSGDFGTKVGMNDLRDAGSVEEFAGCVAQLGDFFPGSLRVDWASEGFQRKDDEKGASQRCRKRLQERLRLVSGGGEALISVTHSARFKRGERPMEGLAIGVGIRPSLGAFASDLIGGVGIDLEPLDRQVHHRLENRISDSDEKGLALSWAPLDFWTLKEACFKANPANAGTWLSLYKLHYFESRREPQSFDALVLGPGHWRYRARLFQTTHWKLAVAYSFRLN